MRRKARPITRMTESYHPRKQITRGFYAILDNGGLPFKVTTSQNSIFILGSEFQEEEEEGSEFSVNDTFTHFICDINEYKGFWKGYDTNKKKWHGNSLLIKISTYEYVYVGSSIYRFKTEEEILDYVSPVGNSDTPYPVAYGKSNVYFMLDEMYVNKKYLYDATVKNAGKMYNKYYKMDDKRKCKMNVTEMIMEDGIMPIMN